MIQLPKLQTLIGLHQISSSEKEGEDTYRQIPLHSLVQLNMFTLTIVQITNNNKYASLRAKLFNSSTLSHAETEAGAG
ncbi:hypothetical protein OIU79_028112 [Salix purpurea]|uniref:Uncharacterized protein n=1 Tax=Salix purpurea TaxID=77065 RepID=A0A9Q1A2L1_SALPP|nr:hypothetical protein OIU79_028112 [Salix purpurea]